MARLRRSQPAYTAEKTGGRMEDWYGVGAWITGMVTFFGIWIYCSLAFGFLGFAIGWLPAWIVAGIAAVIWPLIALLLVATALFFWAVMTK